MGTSATDPYIKNDRIGQVALHLEMELITDINTLFDRHRTARGVSGRFVEQPAVE